MAICPKRILQIAFRSTVTSLVVLAAAWAILIGWHHPQVSARIAPVLACHRLPQGVEILHDNTIWTFTKDGSLTDWRTRMEAPGQEYQGISGEHYFVVEPVPGPAPPEPTLIRKFRRYQPNGDRLEVEFTSYDPATGRKTEKSFTFVRGSNLVSYRITVTDKGHPVPFILGFSTLGPASEPHHVRQGSHWFSLFSQHTGLALETPGSVTCLKESDRIRVTAPEGQFYLGLRTGLRLVRPDLKNRSEILAAVLYQGLAFRLLDPLTTICEWFLATTVYWGFQPSWSMVLATMVLQLILTPMYRAGARSRLRLQQAVPQLKAIHDQLGACQPGDPEIERLQEDQLRLVSGPALERLGILIQIPLWLALSRAVSNTPLFDKQVFWFIPNLALPDPTHRLPIAFGLTLLLMNMTRFRWTNFNWVGALQLLVIQLGLPILLVRVFVWQTPAIVVWFWLWNLLCGWAWKAWIRNRVKTWAPPPSPSRLPSAARVDVLKISKAGVNFQKLMRLRYQEMQPKLR